MLHRGPRATVETQVGKDLASALWRPAPRERGRFSRHETQARTLLREKGLLNASDEVAFFFRDWTGNSYSSWTRRFLDAFRVVLLSHSYSGIGIALGYSVQMAISRFFAVWLLVGGRVDLVLLYASETRRQCVAAKRLLRLMVLAWAFLW